MNNIEKYKEILTETLGAVVMAGSTCDGGCFVLPDGKLICVRELDRWGVPANRAAIKRYIYHNQQMD